MRIGAKIMLSTGPDAARDGLASLADASWLMNLPLRQEAHHGHPAGRARRGFPAAGNETGLVAVTFGAVPAASWSTGALPVHWESLEPGDALAVILAGDITPAAAAQGNSALVMAAFCRVPFAIDGGYEQARLDAIKEAARSFITTVAVAVAPPGGPGQKPQPPGQARAWLTGLGSAF